jgi:uncharacterized protein (DUF3820 family)
MSSVSGDSFEEERIIVSPKKAGSFDNLNKYYDSLDFSYEIKSRAESIFQILKMNKLPRVRENRRVLVAFYCLYQALLEEEDAVPPLALGEMMDLTKTKVVKALTVYSKYNNTPEGRVVITPPQKFLRWYMKLFGLGGEHYYKLLELLRLVLENEEAEDAIPQNIIQGVIYHYCTEFLKLPLKRTEISRKLGISSMTLGVITEKAKNWCKV